VTSHSEGKISIYMCDHKFPPISHYVTARVYNPVENVGKIYLCVYGIGNRTCEHKLISWKCNLLKNPSQKTDKNFFHIHGLDTLARM
jgi:hypothetical protein